MEFANNKWKLISENDPVATAPGSDTAIFLRLLLRFCGNCGRKLKIVISSSLAWFERNFLLRIFRFAQNSNAQYGIMSDRFYFCWIAFIIKRCDDPVAARNNIPNGETFVAFRARSEVSQHILRSFTF